MNGPRATICSCEGFSNALPSLFFPSVCLGDVVLQGLTLTSLTSTDHDPDQLLSLLPQGQ